MAALAPHMEQQFAKVVYERLGEKLGAGIAEVIPPQVFGGLGDIPVALQEAIGIGAATLLRTPRRFASMWARMTGGNPDMVYSHLNEGMNEGVRALIAALAERQKKDPNAEPTQKDYDDAVTAAVEKMWKEPKEVDFSETQQVVVDVQQHVFHDVSCPVVWKGTTASGKKGDQRTEKTTYQPGFRPVSLRWAHGNRYQPTKGSCCGVSTGQLIEQLRKAPTTMFMALTQLPGHLKAKYYGFLDEATTEQNGLIQAAGTIPMWTIGYLSDTLEFSSDIISFLKKLPKSPSKLAPIEGLAKKFVAALRTSSPQMAMVRERVERVGDLANNGAAEQQQRIDEMNDLFNR